MAKKMTPQELREKAKTMIEQAKEEEDKRHLRVGRIFTKQLLNSDAFTSNDLVTIKDEIQELRNKVEKIING